MDAGRRQDHLLRICKENLAPNGIAYVSYNVYPGWHMRGMIRDMMLYHARQFTDMPLQVQQARALLDFLGEYVPTENSPYGLLLKQELAELRKHGDWYLAHEHLEGVNEPVYFHEFARTRGGKWPAVPGRDRIPHDADFEFPAEGRRNPAQDLGRT